MADSMVDLCKRATLGSIQVWGADLWAAQSDSLSRQRSSFGCGCHPLMYAISPMPISTTPIMDA